jgi:hypothetical protein
MLVEVITTILEGIGLAVQIKSRSKDAEIVEELRSLVAALRESKSPDALSIPEGIWKDPGSLVHPETITLVTGAHYMCEVFDRKAAYDLKLAIDAFGLRHGKRHLSSIVVSDVWYFRDSTVRTTAATLSLGGPTVNALTKDILASGGLLAEGAEWTIAGDGHRYALFGTNPLDTLEAMKVFSRDHLISMIETAWMVRP